MLCGSADALSCALTIAHPGILVFLLGFQYCISRLLCGATPIANGHEVASTKHMAVRGPAAAFAFVGLAATVTALLIEPWLWNKHDQPPRWSPPPAAMIGCALMGLFWLLLILVWVMDAPQGTTNSVIVSLGAATVLRVAPLAVGLANDSIPLQSSWIWSSVEAVLLFATAAVTVATTAAASRLNKISRRVTTIAVTQHLSVNAASSGGSLTTPILTSTSSGGVIIPTADGQSSDPDKWIAQRLQPGDDGERVLPRGISCGRALHLMHRAHVELMAEAKTLQMGDAEKEDAQRKPTQADAAANVGHENQQPPDKPPIAVLREHLWSLCPKPQLFLGMLCSVLLTSASFAAPFVQGKVFDAAVDAYHRGADVSHAFSHDIAPLLAVIGGLYGLSWLLEIAVGILFAVSAHTALTRLRCAMFSNLVQQDVSFYDSHVSGELSSRLINDSGQLQTLTQFVSQNILQSAVRIAGGLTAMYLTHPLLAVFATVVTPLNWYIIRRAGNVQGRYGVVQNAAIAKANAAAVETLGAMRTVHSNCGEMGDALRFATTIRRFLHVVLVTVHTQTVVIFTQLLLSKMRDVLILGVGMHQILAGHLSIGAFTAFTQYVQYFEDGFSNAANIWLQIRQTLMSAGRFVQLLERKPAIPFGQGIAPPACQGHLEMRNVTFRYPSSDGSAPPVLAGFDLSATPGSIVALVGSSGAGKSTIARLIERYYDPQDGSVTLDGHDYRSLELRWLRRQIGFVEQEPTLFDRSIAENVRYGRPDADHDAVVRACQLANAHDFISELPEGYETKPGERGVRISGGQKQRVAIARAVLKAPSVLLLDEATSALDSANEAAVQRALEQIMMGRTTVVIAHRLSTVRDASQIIVLNKGVAIERGVHSELANRSGSAYADFMQHQLIQPDHVAGAVKM